MICNFTNDQSILDASFPYLQLLSIRVGDIPKTRRLGTLNVHWLGPWNLLP